MSDECMVIIQDIKNPEKIETRSYSNYNLAKVYMQQQCSIHDIEYNGHNTMTVGERRISIIVPGISQHFIENTQGNCCMII